jgi:tetratricopeptide (TPR) repeat protein
MSTQLRSFSFLVVLFSVLITGVRLGAQQKGLSPEAVRAMEHQDPQWPMIASHLPDPATASAEKLEMAADVLRARRFPESALDYYMYALRRGGKEPELLNKIGVTELELWHTVQARAYFQRVVKLKKKSASGWNNLGAVEYLDRRFSNAISDYSRAIKLDKKIATYHSNLGTVYLEQKNFSDARKEFETALTLDPELFEHHAGAGITAHMLTSEDHARFCYEMARLYAERGDEVNLLHNLAKASDDGFDVLAAMSKDPVLDRYRKDPRVLVLVQNSRALRNSHASAADVPGGIPPLPSAQHE